MVEPPVSSSSSLPPSGDPSPEVSSGSSQPTRPTDFWQSILLSILPLATRSVGKNAERGGESVFRVTKKFLLFL